ncbi:MAG: transcriptional regulator, XRE family [uncultured bacterium]|nr:MAG: transcriptional regulator, XRE family [uncultured bacterium]
MTICLMLSKDKLGQAIGKKLKIARENADLSQEDLAYRAGFYRTYIGHIEVGRYMPSAFTLYKIAKALKISSSDLLPF